jgi:hypothetical protein
MTSDFFYFFGNFHSTEKKKNWGRRLRVLGSFLKKKFLPSANLFGELPKDCLSFTIAQRKRKRAVPAQEKEGKRRKEEKEVKEELKEPEMAAGIFFFSPLVFPSFPFFFFSFSPILNR